MQVSDPDERRRLLKRVLAFREPLAALRTVLAQLPYGSEDELAEITPDGLLDVLHRADAGEIPVEDLADWAELVRDRDDVGYSRECEEAMREVMLWAACPELFGEATPGALRGWAWKISVARDGGHTS